MERTLILVKPDGVQRALSGEIITRLERRGLQIIGAKMLKVSNELAHQHYGVHKDKPFSQGLVDFITSSPIIALAVEGKDAIEAARQKWVLPIHWRQAPVQLEAILVWILDGT